MTSTTITIPEISCDHCKTSIEGAVAPLPGVDRVAVSIADRSVAVDYDGTDATFATIVAAIEDTGYDVPTQ